MEPFTSFNLKAKTINWVFLAADYGYGNNYDGGYGRGGPRGKGTASYDIATNGLFLQKTIQYA